MAHSSVFQAFVSVAQTASALTSTTDLGVASACELLLDVTVTGGTSPSLTVSVETSADGLLAWRTVGSFLAATTVSWQSLPFTGCDRYVRARSVITGTTPTFTYSLTGKVVTVYATPSDIYKLALPAGAIASLDAWSVHAALKAASDMVDASLADVALLPLTSWGDDIRRATAIIAGFDLLTTRGVNPDDGADVWIRERYLDIVGGPQQPGWLDKVANGRLTPAGIIDASPNTNESAADCTSAPMRGW